MAWLREQRRAEPASPVSVLVVVLLLGIVILGLGGGLPKILGREESARPPVGLLTPAAPQQLPSQPATEESQAPSPSQTSDTTPPPVTLRPNPTATSNVNELIEKWARQFYTRNPAARSYNDFVNDASGFMTDDLVAGYIAQGDSTYEALKAQGGTSKIVSVTVAAPKPDTAPVDTDNRITRFATVVVDISGSEPARITVPLLVTAMKDNGRWVISDVDGGTGP